MADDTSSDFESESDQSEDSSTDGSSSSDQGSDIDVDNDSDVFTSDEEDFEYPETQSSLESESQATTVSTSSQFWSSQLNPVNIEPFDDSEVGPVHDLPPDALPSEFFWLILTKGFVRELVEQSNLYATQKNKDFETTEEEMSAFLGLLIMMGVNQLPEYKMHWANDDFIGSEGFKRTMSKNRFEKMVQFLHINNNAERPQVGEEGYDLLYLIRPMLDILKRTLREHYNPRKEQSIDEGMIKYKGSYFAKQYMPCKPVKRGIKVWMRAAPQNGYPHQFRIYLGKHDTMSGGNIGEKVVKYLCRGLQHKGHHVYADSYFTTIPLLRTLEVNGIYYCGTVRKDRLGLPESFRGVGHLERGAFEQRMHDNLLATLWQDKKQVLVLSTNSNPEEPTNVSRRSGANVLNIPSPKAVVNYQQYMRGVDLNQQLRSKCDVGYPSKKYWKYFFNFCLQQCLIAAFIIRSETPGVVQRKKRYHLLDFRIDVARELIGEYTARRREVPGVLQPRRTHALGDLKRKRSTCKWCMSSAKRRKETKFGCVDCNIHLCRAGCFAAFHEHHGMDVQ